MQTIISTLKKLLLTVILITPFTHVIAQSNPNKTEYFLMFNGDKVYFTSISRVTDDSLVCINGNVPSSLFIDSIAEYHYRKHSRAGQGFLIGALTGVTVGVMLGVATVPQPEPNSFVVVSPDYAALGGGLIGLLVGGGIGAAIGSVEKEENRDLRRFNKSTKKQIISILTS